MNFSLERDIYLSERIRNKAVNNDIYCENLYAALCNNEFQKMEVTPILADDRWSCSWRYAGGIASKLFNDMAGEDYMQYYCTGMGIRDAEGYVGEGIVTEEIANDLSSIGWMVVIDNSNDDYV
jgi:hypothetical protein